MTPTEKIFREAMGQSVDPKLEKLAEAMIKCAKTEVQLAQAIRQDALAKTFEREDEDG